MESIPWVRCASGNVLMFSDKASIYALHRNMMANVTEARAEWNELNITGAGALLNVPA